MTKEDLFIELSDGSRWYPSQTDNMIGIEELAHSLANLCRFHGHCSRFYSIAEHSVKVSYLVPTMTALLHDAHEVVVNDLAKPVKVFIGGSYGELEQMCERQIARQYGLPFPHPSEIKDADSVMLLIEAFDLMPSKAVGPGWDDYRQKALELYVSRPELRAVGWSPEQAKTKFLERYNELLGELELV